MKLDSSGKGEDFIRFATTITTITTIIGTINFNFAYCANTMASRIQAFMRFLESKCFADLFYHYFFTENLYYYEFIFTLIKPERLVGFTVVAIHVI
jgi:hypothetical protein